MTVKYQVFISSTYTDLIEARNKVFESLMMRNIYIPIGMENFEASHQPSWDLIKRRIDECDYMIVIIGDRAGSIGPQGIPFTEMEYDYAKKKGMPVVPFLTDNFSPKASTPSEIENAKLVVAFREKCMKDHNIRKWSDPNTLANHAAAAVEAMVRETPTAGWIRGSEVKRALPFQLNTRKTPAKLSGRWRDYWIESDEKGTFLIEGEVYMSRVGSVFRGTHKCTTEKRGEFYFEGYLHGDEFLALYSFNEYVFTDGGFYSLIVSKDENWMEGCTTWKAWPSGQIAYSKYVLHKASGKSAAAFREEALKIMNQELDKLKSERSNIEATTEDSDSK